MPNNRYRLKPDEEQLLQDYRRHKQNGNAKPIVTNKCVMVGIRKLYQDILDHDNCVDQTVPT